MKDALDNPRWKEAMDEELRALRKNSTWELVELPRGRKLLVQMGVHNKTLRQMALLTDTRQGWWQKGILRLMG
ncbi:LA RNA-binding protein [Prunus dulcis]|uniref:LA RNA-binding protein n=1 Tax=Prunus dulcis TaxID=3755 RepID=A0A4Y1RWU8_PRUDU|nr:LA RNA-binding protein [Prunus dulcis]